MNTILNLPDTKSITLEGEPMLKDYDTIEQYMVSFWQWLEKHLKEKRSYMPDPKKYETPSREWTAAYDEYHNWNKRHPATRRAAKLFQSLLAMWHIFDAAETVVCPICERPAIGNLVFKCHPDLTMADWSRLTAIKRGAEKQHSRVAQRRESNGRGLE